MGSAEIGTVLLIQGTSEPYPLLSLCQTSEDYEGTWASPRSVDTSP